LIEQSLVIFLLFILACDRQADPLLGDESAFHFEIDLSVVNAEQDVHVRRVAREQMPPAVKLEQRSQEHWKIRSVGNSSFVNL
jgi:hypothetical protein